jgi:hypothetical protein
VNHTRSSPSATVLAVFGLVLPYAVAVLSIVLFKESVRSMDYYTSGKLATWDTVTGWLTFGAFMLGAAFCWPWGRVRLARATSRAGWVTLGVAALAVQFVAVFVVRFLVYLSSGGIL